MIEKRNKWGMTQKERDACLNTLRSRRLKKLQFHGEIVSAEYVRKKLGLDIINISEDEFEELKPEDLEDE